MSFHNAVRKNLFVYFSSITSFIILVVIVSFFPVGFSSYKVTDTFAPVWFFITGTGAFYGGSFIIISIFIYLSIYFKRNSKNISGAYLFVLIIFVIQVLMAGATLFYIKDYFHNSRPSEVYFTERGYIDSGGVRFFAMSLDEKRKFLHLRIEENKDSIKNVYPPILESWVYYSEYSFPSGHSQTAFFLGTVIAFIILKTTSKKYLILIPFTWAVLVCISRVVIGIHYPIDVIAGAFVGMVWALIIVSLKRIRSIFE